MSYWFDEEHHPLAHHIFASNLLQCRGDEYNVLTGKNFDRNIQRLKSYFKYYTKHMNKERLNPELNG